MTRYATPLILSVLLGLSAACGPELADDESAIELSADGQASGACAPEADDDACADSEAASRTSSRSSALTFRPRPPTDPGFTDGTCTTKWCCLPPKHENDIYHCGHYCVSLCPP